MNQQRAVLRPARNMTFFDDDDSNTENSSAFTSEYMPNDDASSMARSMASSVDTSTRSDTLALAEFLASTSPEEFSKPSLKKQHQRRGSRILNKLRKRPTTMQLNENASVSSKGSSNSTRHIPLPTYHPPSLRDSGVYMTTSSDKDIPPPPVLPPPIRAGQKTMEKKMQYSELTSSFPMPPPIVPEKSSARPRRPSPLPEAVASAAIAAASQQYADHRHFHSVPAAALKRRSIVRTRHVQQEDTSIKKTDAPVAQVGANTCSHCRQRMTTTQHDEEQRLQRRLSCPPAMASGNLVIAVDQDKLLRKKIMLLEAQLAEERDTRIRLEKAMIRQKSTAKKMEQVAEERSRWNENRQWIGDRVALLPQ